jgi:hypothetical protein
MNLVGILGKKRHGKDTIAEYCIKKFDYTQKTYAGPLKDICKILFSFNNEQLYGDKKEDIDEFWEVSPRALYKFIGTDFFRKQMNDLIPGIGDKFWVKIMRQFVSQNKDKKIIISDARFQNEVDMIHEMGGIIIKVVRPSIISVDEHISEKGIDSIKNYDYEIINDGSIDDLHKKIDDVFKHIL